MEIEILTKDYVLEKGVDFEEELWFSLPYGDIVIDAEKNGNPFTGLAYELHNNGNVAYYAYYKNGVNDGEMVEFYDNGNVESISNILKGASNGYQVSYFENGEKRLEGEYFIGIPIKYKKWDETGGLIEEKKNPDESDLKYMEKFN